jgi:hypothetical protein
VENISADEIEHHVHIFHVAERVARKVEMVPYPMPTTVPETS